MNFSNPPKRPRFDWGCKGTLYFLISKFFCKKFENFIFSVSLSKNSQPLQPPRFSKGVQRYALFSNLQTFLQLFFTFFTDYFIKKPL